MGSEAAGEGIWPAWVAGQPRLAALLRVAEEEAREHGEAVVAGHHVTLALTRDEGAQSLLAALGPEARRWRTTKVRITARPTGSRE